MKKNRLSKFLALAGLIWSLSVSILLIFLPVYGSFSSGQKQQGTATLIQVNGYSVVVLLLIPVILAAAATIPLWRTGLMWGIKRAIVWISVAMLCVFVFLGAFSVGLFYLPAALLMILAAVFAEIGQNKETKSD